MLLPDVLVGPAFMIPAHADDMIVSIDGRKAHTN